MTHRDYAERTEKPDHFKVFYFHVVSRLDLGM